MKKEYYVYALIDPRNNQFFYVGKGKDKRYSSRISKGKKRDFNKAKLNRIKEIENDGYKVKIEILFPNLDEKIAFKLEEIIVYKLGREVLSEGILTNLIPGGNWNPKNSIFYPENFNLDFDLNKLDFVAQERFLNIKKVSQFNYLNTHDNSQIIYRYDYDGNLYLKEPINSLFSEGISSHYIEIVKAIRENELPIYTSSWIYSKYSSDNLYISDKIPFSDFDIIDNEFNQNFEKLYKEKEKFNLECKINKRLRLSVEKNNDIITLTSYYISGEKKSFRKTKNKTLIDFSCVWFKNGHLKEKEKYIDAYNKYSYTTYFENGNKKIYIDNIGSENSYKRWFENGKLEVEFIEGTGYVHYNEIGAKTKITFPENKELVIQTKLELDFSNKEDLSGEKNREKKQSDIDWMKIYDRKNLKQ